MGEDLEPFYSALKALSSLRTGVDDLFKQLANVPSSNSENGSQSFEDYLAVFQTSCTNLTSSFR